MLASLQIVVWLLLGLLMSIPLIIYAKRLTFNPASDLLGRGLVAAALVYVAFAIIWSDLFWIGIEVAGLLVYSAFYFLADKRVMLWVGAGWLLHIGWDLGLHYFGPGAKFAPEWYVFACMSFDLVVFIYCFHRWRSDQNVILERSYSRYESARATRKR